MKNKNSTIAVIIFLTIAVFLTVYLAGQRQDIRKRASSGTGTATVRLDTPRTTTPYYVGEIIPVSVKFTTGTNRMLGFAFMIKFPITVSSPEFQFTDSTGTPLSSTGRPFFINTSLPGFTSWNVSANRFYTSGSNLMVEEIGGGYINSTTPGYQTTTEQLLGTFYLKVLSRPTSGNLVLSFDPNESIITRLDNTDMLQTPGPLTLTINQDQTAPSTPVVSDGGVYTTSNNELTASWPASTDLETGVAEYQYAIGTGTTDTDRANVVPLTSIVPVAGTNTIDKTGLTLTSGITYYFSVKARDVAGNWSAFGTSDGIKVDTSKPSTPTVNDDGTATYDLTQLHAVWSSSDAESGIAEYQYAIGTGTTNDTVRTNLVGWTSTGTTPNVTKTGLTLTPGTTYYFTVKARNGAGTGSDYGTSDGILASSPTLSISIKMEGINRAGVNKTLDVWLRNAGGTSMFSVPVTSDANGVFSTPTSSPLALTGITAGNYQLLIKDKTVAGQSAGNHLRKNMVTGNGTITIVNGANSTDPAYLTDTSKYLKAGDANGDNVINDQDAALVLQYYVNLNVPVTTDDMRGADLDSDGAIRVFDVSWALTNYTAIRVPGDL